jgi:hypothetical protein
VLTATERHVQPLCDDKPHRRLLATTKPQMKAELSHTYDDQTADVFCLFFRTRPLRTKCRRYYNYNNNNSSAPAEGRCYLPPIYPPLYIMRLVTIAPHHERALALFLCGTSNTTRHA